jgi:hypothetical protein
LGHEPNRLVLRLSRDLRLLAGVAGALAHIAERAGYDAGARADMAAAAEEVCRDTFPLLTESDPRLSVIIEDFADRIEVTLEHNGQAIPTAGLESFAFPAAEQTGRSSGLGLLARVDRVTYDSKSGTSRMTLVKYLRAQPGRRDSPENKIGAAGVKPTF